MDKIKIGFLPLYIKLYDDVGLDIRDRIGSFYSEIANALEDDGFEVIRTPICRIKNEFSDAIERYEREKADVILTWHAAYSPSLESIDVLAGTDLPIVILDTTETFDFSPAQDTSEINLCHGIHGVMDMTNMLKRRGKKYAIAAGHFPESDVLARAEQLIKAAKGAGSLNDSRVGSIGGSFDGMGDFLISDDELRSRFGVTAVYPTGDEIRNYKSQVKEEEIKNEIDLDIENCEVIGKLTDTGHRKTVLNCLAVRKWLADQDLDAFTINFLKISPETGLDIMPFMEACKALARGTGYAGEGDVLTAAITGALIRAFGTATFIEIFCPDWKHDCLFLSHMGEVNYSLIDGKPELAEVPFTFGFADDPVVGYGRYKAGDAVYANVFKDDKGYNMLISPVKMQSVKVDNFTGTNRGWMKPCMPVADFLETISSYGVTHHSSLVYGASLQAMKYFGELLGLNVIIIQ